MPLTARTAEGRVVDTYQYRAEDALFCRDCGDPMHFRRLVLEPYRCAHFAHNPRGASAGPRTCSGETTPAHDNAKMALLTAAPETFDALAGVLGKPEQDVEIPDDPPRRRRADVLFPRSDGRYPVAFEAQFSKIGFAADGSGRTVAERTADYHAAGVHVVWCFPDKRAAQEHINAARRVYGCVGVLSPDGTEVEFQGINTLWLNKHPTRALRERQEWRDKRERERIERLAVGAPALRIQPAPASITRPLTPTITDAALDRYFDLSSDEPDPQWRHIDVSSPPWNPATPNEWRKDDLSLPADWRLLQCDHKGNASAYGDYWYSAGPDGQHTDIHRYADSAAFWARRAAQKGA